MEEVARLMSEARSANTGLTAALRGEDAKELQRAAEAVELLEVCCTAPEHCLVRK